MPSFEGALRVAYSTPGTPASGSALIYPNASGDWVTKNPAGVESPLASPTNTGWTTLTFLGTYTSFDNTTWLCEAIREGHWVHMRGLVKPASGSFTSGTAVAVATMPSGMWPGKTEVFHTSTNGLADSRTQISTSGTLTVQPTAAATYVGIHWTYWVD